MTEIHKDSHKGLKVEFTIKETAQNVEKAKDARLMEIGKTAKIQGFRPGKAPLQVLRQYYGDRVSDDVRSKLINDGVANALKDNNLRPALQPQVTSITDEAGKDFEFKVTVEVLPEIKAMDFATLSFERPVADVEDAEVQKTIERLVKTSREPETVTDKRKAVNGDVVVIDYDGSVDGTAYPGMKGEDHSLELGTKSFVGTFEDQLVGAKAGDKKTIKVEFPKDYHAAHLAGKKAVFEVTVKELRAHKPIEVNDETAKELGFESMAKLQQMITETLQQRYKGMGRAVLKRELMDKLADKHKFDIPEGLMEAEFGSIWQQVQKEKEHGHLDEEDTKKSDDELRKEYREIADRRIRLGLLLADVAQHGKVEVSQGDMRNAMLAEARRYPGQEKAVVDYYLKTEGALERLRAPLLEEKVVDFILAQATIKDKKMSVEELTKLAEAEE